MLDSSSRNTSPLVFLHGLIAGLPPMQKTSGYGIGIGSRESGGFLRVRSRGQRMGFLHGLVSGIFSVLPRSQPAQAKDAQGQQCSYR